MAIIKPFKPFRYTTAAGDAATLLTQPYDKITPEMQSRYLAASPYNLVRVILGERHDSDDEIDNPYTRAVSHLDQWTRAGILTQETVPGLYAYFQDFEVPDSGERLTRKGFIGIGKIEPYSAGVVYRHEQTLAGPKKDRLELLRHTGAHFGQIFMLYPDPERAVDELLDQAATGAPMLDVVDEYKVRNRIWPIRDAATIARIQALMEPKKLLIADGHHRYETALAFRDENPGAASVQYVMMTFVNMYSPGLKILATHRVLRNLESFSTQEFLAKLEKLWTAMQYDSVSAIKRMLTNGDGGPGTITIGMITKDGLWLLERPRQEGELDVPVLHRELIGGVLGINEDAVRDEKHISYVRGIDAATSQVRQGDAQIAFVLNPTPIEDMAKIAFAGGVMPQKSTDFYPKLLSGVTMYRLE